MGKRRLGALLGAAVLTMAMVGTVSATAPTYTISVTKTAEPPTVPVSGADVTFTVWVQNTGTGDFHTVNVGDSMGGCSLSGPSGDTGSDGILSAGETWSWTCTVSDVTPGTQNTATANACHNASPNCNQDAHDATGQGSVTVNACEVCPSEQPSVQPSQGGGGESNLPTQAPTDTAVTGSSGPTDTAWFLVVALAVLLGSLYVLRPAAARRER